MTDKVRTWRKSSKSNQSGNCVEVAFGGGGTVYVRDSKNPHGPVLEFTPAEWAAFLDGTSKGEFNIP